MCCETIPGSVLLLDCDALTRLLTRTVLEQTGFSVHEATGYEEAVEQRSITAPDLVVVNLMKTPEAGLSFCAHIRQQAGGWQEPILAVIWINEEKAIRSAYDAGATDIVTMPCHHLVLHFRLRCAMRVHRVMDTPKVILAETTPPPVPAGHSVSSYWSAPANREKLREVPARSACTSFTGMPDKHAFEALLRVAISSAKERSLSVFFMEIEDLQSPCEKSKGTVEAIGADLERGMERFIGRMTSRYFPVGRLGPLQFSLVLFDVVTWSEVRKHVLSIKDDLTAAFCRDGNHTPVAMKVGVSVCPDDGHDAAALLKKAEMARYHVNGGGGTSSFHFYRPLCTDSSVYYDSLVIT
ncbi:response regulator [Geomonas anaerohicana]|uniref:Response regulator n=1 Tax=Geomonas anaerohicana TaxID=2798583 RepID=A0ABS0YGC8_9BACT|nr:response regulator [Geomonas anaerohicana]MBJ6751377.1 response regulator [Geomonas anaerohicana]